MNKAFDSWNILKKQLQQTKPPLFNQREVWWCSIGVNLGDEMDGKSDLYNRPVLILRKFNPHIFYGVPFSTVIKENPYYFKIQFQQREQAALLSQMRLWEARRLTQKMGKLPGKDFDAIREAIKALL